MNITNAGVRGYNPTGVVIHNDAGSNGANTSFYSNWLPTHNPELGFAHVYIASDGRLQASDFNNMAWHCANSYGNTNYASWEVCQSEGDLNQFLKNEQAVLDDVAKYMKQWGLTPNRDTVKLHQELSSTSCPRRSVEVHGGTLESCRSYFINELNKRLTGQSESKQNKPQENTEIKKMILITVTDKTTKLDGSKWLFNGEQLTRLDGISSEYLSPSVIKRDANGAQMRSLKAIGIRVVGAGL